MASARSGETKQRRFSLTVVAVAALVGCFDAGVSDREFLCDKERPQCPSGRECIEGRCRSVGADLSVADGGQVVDLAGPVTDLSFSGSGCKSGGGFNVTSPQGSTICFACPGLFAPTPTTSRASELCASGWTIPTSASSVDIGKCNTTEGFFVAEVAVWWKDFITNGCGITKDYQREFPGFAGCGKGMDFTRPVSVPCSGFGMARLDHGNATLEVIAPFSPVSTTATNERTNYGVLCCR